MQRFRRVLGVFLMAAAVCCSAVPAVDLPETAFDETDLAINPALPAQPRIQEVPPVVIRLAILPAQMLFRADRFTRSSRVEVADVPTSRHSQSLQILLCTFLT